MKTKFGTIMDTTIGNTKQEISFSEYEPTHTLIAGDGGVGKKTTAMRVLEGYLEKPNTSAIIFDCKGRWNNCVPSLNLDNKDVNVLSIAETIKLALSIPDEMDIDLWSEIFAENFVLGFSLGTRSHDILLRNMKRTFTAFGTHTNPDADTINLSNIRACLRSEVENKIQTKQVGFADIEQYSRIIEKMEAIELIIQRNNIRTNTLDLEKSDFKAQLQRNTVTIIDKIPYSIRTFIYRMIISNIITQKDNNRNITSNSLNGVYNIKQGNLFMVVEEAELLLKGSYLDKEEFTYNDELFTRGRSFGLFGIAVTNSINKLPYTIIVNCPTKIIHRSSLSNDIEYINKILYFKPEDREVFPHGVPHLPVGYVLMQRPMTYEECVKEINMWKLIKVNKIEN